MAVDFIDEYCMAAEMRESEALEPRDLKEAQSGPDWLLWEKAIQEELAVLKAARTWELVDAPAGANIVGSKWVFHAKKDAAGNVVQYKLHRDSPKFQESTILILLHPSLVSHRFELFLQWQQSKTMKFIRLTSKGHT